MYNSHAVRPFWTYMLTVQIDSEHRLTSLPYEEQKEVLDALKIRRLYFSALLKYDSEAYINL